MKEQRQGWDKGLCGEEIQKVPWGMQEKGREDILGKGKTTQDDIKSCCTRDRDEVSEMERVWISKGRVNLFMNVVECQQTSSGRGGTA